MFALLGDVVDDKGLRCFWITFSPNDTFVFKI